MSLTSEQFPEASVPKLRSDIDFRCYGNEAVAWPKFAPGPVWLDPVAATIYRIVDGTGSVRDLTNDVADAIEVDWDIAATQVRRSLAILDQGGLLESSRLEPASPSDEEFFPFPLSS